MTLRQYISEYSRLVGNRPFACADKISVLESKLNEHIKQHVKTISHMDDFDAFCQQLIKLWVTPAMIFKSQLPMWNFLLRGNQTYYTYAAAFLTQVPRLF